MSKKKQQPESQTDQPQKEKKVKVVYIDDNSTVADMSGTRGRKANDPPRRKSTFREKSRTFFSAMRMMVVPMLCTLAAFGLIYLILLMATGQLW